MFDAFELVMSLVFSGVVGYVAGSGNLHAFDFPEVGVTARQKRRIKKLKQKERWEIKASAWGLGMTIFFLFRLSDATSFSHLPFFAGFLISVSVGIFSLLSVPASTVYLTRRFRNVFYRQP